MKTKDVTAIKTPTIFSFRRYFLVVIIVLPVVSILRSNKKEVGIIKSSIQSGERDAEYNTKTIIRTDEFEMELNDTEALEESAPSSIIVDGSSNNINTTVDDSSKSGDADSSKKEAKVQSLFYNDSSQNNGGTLPACQIMVHNGMIAHYEVIESVGKLIPFEYLNLPDTCNHKDLYFEFYVKRNGRMWLSLFNQYVANTTSFDNATGVKRSFGPAFQGLPSKNRNHHQQQQQQRQWDTTIESSCRCESWVKGWLLDTTSAGAPNICILHGICNHTANLPNAIYMSPHHERYFVPSALPQITPAKKPDDKLVICSIGSVSRRKWELVTPFFDNQANEQYFDKIRILMLGKGDMPPLMQPYMNKVEIKHKSENEKEFYAKIRTCGIIILPLTKRYKNYFNGPDSEKKLSGSIPVMIAYQIPFILPQELLELYDKELPLHIPHRGFDEASETDFAEVLRSLVEELLSSSSNSGNTVANNSTTTTTTTSS